MSIIAQYYFSKLITIQNYNLLTDNVMQILVTSNLESLLHGASIAY